MNMFYFKVFVFVWKKVKWLFLLLFLVIINNVFVNDLIVDLVLLLEVI